MENAENRRRAWILRLCETAVLLALSAVLGLVRIQTGVYGGSVTLFSMVPLILLALRYGFGWGALAGVLRGALDLLVNPGAFAGAGITWVMVVGSLIFDYALAFGAMGLAALWRRRAADALNPPAGSGKAGSAARFAGFCALGAAVALLARFCFHLISGYVFWRSTLEGATTWALFAADFLYNASYMVPELIISVAGTALVCAVLAPTALGKKLILVKW